MTIVMKKYSRHRVSLKKRDSIAFNASDRLRLNVIGRGYVKLGTCYRMAKQYNRMDSVKVKTLLGRVAAYLLLSTLKIVVVDYTPPEDTTPRVGNASFSDYAYLIGDTTFSEYFRFQSPEQSISDFSPLNS